MSIPETDPGCQTTEEKNMAIFSMILSLLCGVALFLFGMSLMGDGLKMVAGNKLEAFLYRMTNTPLKGVALGTGVTSVIQSSSATTVMVIGFVNSGMMKLKQAIGIIMGANIGTSITGWILSFLYWRKRWRNRKYLFYCDDFCRCSCNWHYFPYVLQTFRT